jgi:polyhydroxyalkanoate synthesis regulator phasin
MSAETKKVLEMLAEGKISAEEADRLIEKLTSTSTGSASAQNAAPEEKKANGAREPKKPRYLRIVVERPGQDHVNMRIPLTFTRTGARLMGVLPLRVLEKLGDQGIDLSALADLKGEDLAEAIETMNVDIDKGNGKKVRIFCE